MTQAASTKRGNEGGFTLVSVIVAVVILSTGLLALARAQGLLVASQGNTANRAIALNIARTYTEVLRSRDPWTIASEAGTNVNQLGATDVAGRYVRSTSVTNLAANLIQVTVNVTYPRGPEPISIVTLIYRST